MNVLAKNTPQREAMSFMKICKSRKEFSQQVELTYDKLRLTRKAVEIEQLELNAHGGI